MLSSQPASQQELGGGAAAVAFLKAGLPQKVLVSL